MKETVITPGMKKRELIILLVCFIAAYVLNVVGIVKYNAPAIELVSQLHVVLAVSLVIYVLVAVFRGLLYLFSLLVKKK